MLPTGRINRPPALVLEETVLGRRFDWEIRHLLRHYLWIELAHLGEYLRMGTMDLAACTRIRGVVLDLTEDEVTSRRLTAMSDPLFALEQAIHARLTPSLPPAWHVDRSRNDVQACAQLMLGREQILAAAAGIRGLGHAACAAADRHRAAIMPGYTQHQAAQAITLGFYLAALAETVTSAAESLQALYHAVDLSPLGAGALAGLELPWDRCRLATALGFAGPQPHALTCVASRTWVLRTAAELSVLGVTLSRFLTDLITWTGASCRFLDLPDELAGISSAMPHKRNFPVLERVRGMTGHLTGLSMDLLIGQRNTPYTNLVEVSKENSRFLADLFSVCEEMLLLFTHVLAELRFRPEQARAALRTEPLAASTVANHLTLAHEIPARTAQKTVGQWIAQAAAGGNDSAPDGLTSAGLTAAAGAMGFAVELDEAVLGQLLDAEASVYRKSTSGSTGPDQVSLLLETVQDRLRAADLMAADCTARIESAWIAAQAGEMV
jgi:argininosuccinate lyase